MRNPGPRSSSRGQSVAVSPLHPRAAGLGPESPTGTPYSPSAKSSGAGSPGRKDNPTSPATRWKKGKLLGRGTFGDVYAGLNSESGDMCAMKEVRLFSDDSCVKQLEQEIAMLSHLRHPNIVQYYGSQSVDDKLYIYLEYVSGGSIHQLLKYHGRFEEPVICRYTRQILDGLAYLHNQNTVHRDIKGANILVAPNGQVKLADFGMAKHITDHSSHLSSRGTPHWMAPEVINNKNGYDLVVDIWSLGCTVVEMATAQPPWKHYENGAAMYKIGKGKEHPEIPDHLSEDGKNFVSLCLQRNPVNRPTAARLLEHPFVKHAAPFVKLDPDTKAIETEALSTSANGMKVLQHRMGSFNCKALCVQVDLLLKSLMPAIDQLCVSDMQLPKDQRNPVVHQFNSTLVRGAELLKKCEDISAFNLFLTYRYASQFLKIEEEINGFMRSMPALRLQDAKKIMADLKDICHELEHADITGMLNKSLYKQAFMLTNDAGRNAMMLQQMSSDNLCDSTDMEEYSTHSYQNSIPAKSQCYVGLKKSIRDLKNILFQSEVLVVGVQCMGGGGKTTLALALCNDHQIKGYFVNVLFITVSQSPNLKGILETMWDKIVGKKKPEFQNVEDACIQLQQQLLRQSKPTLVILDDVWSRANLEKLLFKAPEYKTLITTRDNSTIPGNPSTRFYHLPLLSQEDALSLFCFWAFGKILIPSAADANLVKEVQAKCGGLPLAIQVIGSSLHGKPPVVWKRAKNKLSEGESISDYHKEGLFRCLETSIDFLDDVARECFLDLGAFPGDRKVCADALLHIWVYVRKLDWQDAVAILLELASRNLLNLISNPGSQAAISYGSASELYFFQHDVIRSLALYLGSQKSIGLRKRLFMPKKEHGLPGKWELFNDRPFNAQIVSIHTGPMDEDQWYEMNFRKTEALVLLFSGSEYFLPPFLKSMKKLKFLMVFNYGSKRATVKGVDSLSSLTQLKSVCLEKLIAPFIQKQSKILQNLEKLSLSLCEGFGNVSTFNNTKLHILNMDHCSDLELTPAICHMPSADMLSITNCHLIQKLPYEIENLTSLRMLRLSAVPCLKELPASIGKLFQLEYLDISLCENLKELPEEIGQLKKLTEFDMRECSRLRRLPTSVCGLSSLKHVICDDKVGKQWLRAKEFCIPDLRVEIVEAQFSLDWLDDGPPFLTLHRGGVATNLTSW